MDAVRQEAFRREILSFVKHGKDTRSPATADLAKQYLSVRERLSRVPARKALRWFFREGAGQMRGGAHRQSKSAAEVEQPAKATSKRAVVPGGAESAEPSGRARATPIDGVRNADAFLHLEPNGAQHEHRLRSSAPPPRAADDLGSEPWERALIKAIRERGFLWRTEQAYREWAVRFARFITPRPPNAASGEEVAAFLSALAVNNARGVRSPLDRT